MEKILDKIESPKDLKTLSISERNVRRPRNERISRRN